MADEIWLDVLPSMRKFGPSLIKGALGASKDAGAKAGKEFGRGFDKGAGDLGRENLKKLEAAQKSAAGLVSKLSGEVSRARQAQQRSAADLLVAEQKLADATAKYGADSNQAQAATLRLDAARSKAEDSTQRFEDAENALKEAHKGSTEATEQLEKAQKDLNSVTKKSSSFWGKLRRGLGDTDAAAQRTNKTLQRLAGGAKILGKGIGVAAGAVTAMGAAVVGIAIKGGIDRALNIEDARASLTGLGHDTRMVNKIMDSALASVKGTAFGLGDAATIAATAVAAGIKPGKSLTDTLKLTANAAALARVGLDEMGSILNKVWTAGRVQTEELNQLADRGIPIWTNLAKHYKVNGTEFRKMVSDGKVDAKTFAAVLKDTVGTAADEMGKTTRGMWSNFKAALGRGGEVVMKPFLDAFKGGLGELIPAVDSLVSAIKPAAEEFGQRLPGYIAAAKDGFKAFWEVLTTQIIPAIQATVGWVKDNEAWIKPLTVAVLAGAVAWKAYDMAVGGYAKIAGFVTKALQGQTVAQWALNAAMHANPIGLIIGLVAGLVAGFIYLWKTNEGFRGFFISAWEGIKAVFVAVGGFVSDTLENIGGGLRTVWDFTKRVFGPVFTWLYQKIVKPIFGLIWFAIRVAFNSALLIFDLVKFTVTKILGPAFTTFYQAVIKPVFQGFKVAVAVAWAAVKTIFQAIFGFLDRTLGPVFRWFYHTIVKPIWAGVSAAISTAWNSKIRPVLKIMASFVKDVVAPGFKRGVDAIKIAWDVLKKVAGTPVYFVLDTVYNRGIKWAFDKVAKAIGSKAELPKAETSGIPHFAKGGQMRRGWKLVGEEGPEIIHTGPGFVYTAKETKRMLAGRAQAPVGALDSLRETGQIGVPEHKGIGGWLSDAAGAAWGGLKKAASWVGDKVQQGVQWVRGGLAKAAEFLLSPARDFVTSKIGGGSMLGSIIRKVALKTIDALTGWIRGKDEEQVGGEYGGAYTGPVGGFARPVAGGIITSLFGSSRGRYPHAGTDLAVPIGTAVRAAWNGVVKKAGTNIVAGRSGIGMLLDHGGGKSTYYGHLSRIIKAAGSVVKAGEIIAKSGNTGRSTGPHLHWETWQDGRPYNNIGLLRGGSGGRKAAVYDQGGLLPRGLNLVANYSRHPERIYTHAQGKALETLAARGGGIPVGTRLFLVLENGQELAGYVSDVADARMDAKKQQARQENRQMSGVG